MAFKINTLAKDLGLKSKELTELLAARGVEGKSTQSALEPREFDLVFEALTRAAQVTNIDDYLFGDTYIPTAPAAKKETKKAKETKEEAAPVVEQKPAEDKKPEEPKAE